MAPVAGTSPSSPAELALWLRLAHTDGIGPLRGRALLSRFGPPEAVFEAHPDDIATALGSPALATALVGPDPRRDAVVARALAWSGPRRRLIVLGQPDYPERLLDLADPPLLLYCDGDPAALAAPQVAIVGSRNATALGTQTASGLAGALAAAGLVVTSGLAEGIDRAAHAGALATDGGLTIAVLGTGIDLVYPARHRPLAAAITGRGALLAEPPLGAPPAAGHFPRRNRLIAALVHAVVVVEAAVRSGSLITARLAAGLGRDVLAVPGSIHSPLARGCHWLLRQGAGLVESADDVLSALPQAVSGRSLRPAEPVGATESAERAGPVEPAEPAGPGSDRSGQRIGAAATGRDPDGDTTPPAARLLAAIAGDPVGPEALARHHGWPLGSVLAGLQTLEFDGRVRRQADGRYVRCA